MVKHNSIVGWVSSLFERNPTKNVGLRSKSELTQPTLIGKEFSSSLKQVLV